MASAMPMSNPPPAARTCHHRGTRPGAAACASGDLKYHGRRVMTSPSCSDTGATMPPCRGAAGRRSCWRWRRRLATGTRLRYTQVITLTAAHGDSGATGGQQRQRNGMVVNLQAGDGAPSLIPQRLIADGVDICLGRSATPNFCAVDIEHTCRAIAHDHESVPPWRHASKQSRASACWYIQLKDTHYPLSTWTEWRCRKLRTCG